MNILGRSRALSVHLLAICLLVMLQPSHAQQDGPALLLAADAQTALSQVVTRYPGNSITSVGVADEALNAVVRVRKLLQEEFTVAEQACLDKFFTNACIDNAKEQLRTGLAALKPIELEASSFKRLSKVEDRDKALSEREKSASEQQKTEQESQRRRAERLEKRSQAAGQEQVTQPNQESGTSERAQRHAEKLKALQEKDAIKEQQRARNVAKYQEKVRQSAERQKKVAEKRAQKQQEQLNNAIRTEP